MGYVTLIMDLRMRTSGSSLSESCHTRMTASLTKRIVCCSRLSCLRFSATFLVMIGRDLQFGRCGFTCRSGLAHDSRQGNSLGEMTKVTNCSKVTSAFVHT